MAYKNTAFWFRSLAARSGEDPPNTVIDRTRNGIIKLPLVVNRPVLILCGITPYISSDIGRIIPESAITSGTGYGMTKRIAQGLLNTTVNAAFHVVGHSIEAVTDAFAKIIKNSHCALSLPFFYSLIIAKTC